MLDKELITRFREDGDRTALHEIALRYTKQCYNVAFGILGDTGAAQDAVQQAFLNLIKNVSMYKGASSFRTWFYRIVVNCALEVRRSEQRRKHREGVTAESLQRRKNMQTEEEGFRVEVKNAVFSLPDNLKLPVVLHYYNGLSYSETASALNCPEGSVASRLHRALQKLKKSLKGAGFAALAVSLEEVLRATPARPVPPSLTSSISKLCHTCKPIAVTVEAGKPAVWLKTAAGVGLFAVILSLVTVYMSYRTTQTGQEGQETASLPAQPVPGAPVAERPADSSGKTAKSATASRKVGARKNIKTEEQADKTALYGIVTCREDGKPIPNAELRFSNKIWIDDGAGEEGQTEDTLKVLTDFEGKYRIGGLNPDVPLRVFAQAEGFKPYSQLLTLLEAGGTREMNFHLNRGSHRTGESDIAVEKVEKEEIAWPPPPGPEPGQEVLDKLSRFVTLNFHDTPLDDVISFLQDITGISVIVSKDLDRKNVKISLRVSDIPLIEVLEVLCLLSNDIAYGLVMTRGSKMTAQGAVPCTMPTIIFATPEQATAYSLRRPKVAETPDFSSTKAMLPGSSCPFGLTTEEVNLAQAVNETLKQPVRVEKQAYTFSELKAFIEYGTGLTITLDEQATKALGDSNPEIILPQGQENFSYLGLLSCVACNNSQLYPLVSPAGVVFTTRSNRISMGCYARKQKMNQALASPRRITVNSDDCSLKEAFSLLNDYTGVDFVLSDAARQLKPTLNLSINEMLLEDAIQVICHQAGVTYEVKDYFIFIK